MNLLLNKIDTDLRRKVNEKTKEGKIHSKRSVNISKDEEKNKDKTFEQYIENEKYNREKKNVKKEKIKEETIEVQVQIAVESKENVSGTFLDIKK